MVPENSIRFPLNIAVMDDDYFALKGAVSLLSRDLRTMVSIEANSADDLLKRLSTIRRLPDVVLIDTECPQSNMSLNEVIRRVKGLAPKAVVVCWSQYGEIDMMQHAVESGADSILIKREVRLALATHIVRAFTTRHTYSPGVETALSGRHDEWLSRGERLEPWEIHPDLSPRLKQVFWLCIIYGMNVRAAAAEMCVQPETVERYRMKIYDILEDGWLEEDHLQDAWTRISGAQDTARSVNWAFHLITQPPRRSDEASE